MIKVSLRQHRIKVGKGLLKTGKHPRYQISGIGGMDDPYGISESHSTVTLFARFLGLSTSRPLATLT